jgi:hypothetical protein
MTRTCCATTGCHGCSTRCGPRRRWGCSCARSPSATSASSTRSPPDCWPGCARPRRCSPGRDRLAYLDIDDTIRGTYGYAKQGAGRGCSGVNRLNALLATLSTPAVAPVILGARLRRGATASVRGAGKLISDALATARRAGVTGQLVVRGLDVEVGESIDPVSPGRGTGLDDRPDPLVGVSQVHDVSS